MRAHAIIYCINPEVMTHFYRAVMQLSDAQHPHRVYSETWQIEFVQIPAEYAADIQLTSPPTPRDETPIKLSFAVDDIAIAREIADLHGGAVSGLDHEWHYEGYAFCNGVDPEGNVFQIFSKAPAVD